MNRLLLLKEIDMIIKDINIASDKKALLQMVLMVSFDNLQETENNNLYKLFHKTEKEG